MCNRGRICEQDFSVCVITEQEFEDAEKHPAGLRLAGMHARGQNHRGPCANGGHIAAVTSDGEQVTHVARNSATEDAVLHLSLHAGQRAFGGNVGLQISVCVRDTVCEIKHIV